MGRERERERKLVMVSLSSHCQKTFCDVIDVQTKTIPCARQKEGTQINLTNLDSPGQEGAGVPERLLDVLHVFQLHFL